MYILPSFQSSPVSTYVRIILFYVVKRENKESRKFPHLKYGEHGDGKAVEISGWPAIPKIKSSAEELHA